MVEKEVCRRTFRVIAKVSCIDYTKMTLDYIPVDGIHRKFLNRYCRILNEEQLTTLKSALLHDRRVKLLINKKVKINETKTDVEILDKWDEVVGIDEV